MDSNLDKPQQLQRLSEDAYRIASDLARISGRVDEESPQNSNSESEVSAKMIRDVIYARRLREKFFGTSLFADPAWDLMLHAFEAELSHRRIAVSHLSSSAGVPSTTALRWIGILTRKGMLIRQPDIHDRRRIFIKLEPAMSSALRRYFTEAVHVGVSHTI